MVGFHAAAATAAAGAQQARTMVRQPFCFSKTQKTFLDIFVFLRIKWSHTCAIAIIIIAITAL